MLCFFSLDSFFPKIIPSNGEKLSNLHELLAHTFCNFFLLKPFLFTKYVDVFANPEIMQVSKQNCPRDVFFFFGLKNKCAETIENKNCTQTRDSKTRWLQQLSQWWPSFHQHCLSNKGFLNVLWSMNVHKFNKDQPKLRN